MANILIIDDDLPILESMQIVLADEGHEVSVMSDVTKALPLLKPHPDLIFLDLWINGTDGREICKRLKADMETEEIPVVLFSANKDIAGMAAAVGSNGYLAKPFSIDELFAKIESYAVPSKRK